MSVIQVKYQTLYDAANKMTAQREVMAENLKVAKAEIDNTSSSVQSNTANQLRAKFEELSSAFESFCAKVDSCAAFLNQTAKAYQEFDTQNGGASSGSAGPMHTAQ